MKTYNTVCVLQFQLFILRAGKIRGKNTPDKRKIEAISCIIKKMALLLRRIPERNSAKERQKTLFSSSVG